MLLIAKKITAEAEFPVKSVIIYIPGNNLKAKEFINIVGYYSGNTRLNYYLNF